jgi:hypothetical protein
MLGSGARAARVIGAMGAWCAGVELRLGELGWGVRRSWAAWATRAGELAAGLAVCASSVSGGAS